MKKLLAVLFIGINTLNAQSNNQDKESEDSYGVYVENTSNKIMYMVTHYQKQYSKKWKIKKRNKINPGKTRFLFATDNNIFYFYARTKADSWGNYREMAGNDHYIRAALMKRGMKKIDISSECKKGEAFFVTFK